MFRKIATAATIAALTLLSRAQPAYAQKALVYCPVGIDATGCDRIVSALSSKFTEGVDRGYDGSAGTVDLTKVDLHHYAVFVVPSLADDGDKQPYALLRTVASRLHYAITGRVAVYSGAPDQGKTNRPDKDALIQNLASWAAGGHTHATGLVGMVAFLDLSEDEGARYSWVRSISLVDVSADTEEQSIAETTPVGTRDSDLLKTGGRRLAFSNMASNGLHIGNRGAARTEVGAVGGETSRQSILVTYSNADGPSDGDLKTGKVTNGGASFNRNIGSASLDVTGSSSATSGPTLTTNKPDYVPGDTVIFTGGGFAPGDTVTITVHVDSTQSFPDRQYKSVADANGAFTNSQMVVVTTDLNMFFTATAVANPSGLVAQTSFTDAGSITFATASAIPGTSIAVSTGGGVFTGNAANIGVYWDGAINTTTGTLVATCSTNGGGNIILASGCSFLVPLAASPGVHTVVTTEQTNLTKSISAAFTVLPTCTAASISINPSNTTKNALQSATFSVTAAGTSLTYQWQVSSDNGANFTPLSDGGSISGATTSTLTINPVSGTDNGKQYRVVVTASCGSPATSTAATLTVNKINQTTAVTVTAPSSVTFGTTGTATAVGGDGTGAYTFSAGASTGCSVLAATVSVSNASLTCALTATRAGDDNYNASSPSAPFTVTLNKATQAALSLSVPGSITFGNTGTATASGGSGTGAVTFSAGGTGGCSVNPATGVISVTNSSLTCTITASKAGDDNYVGPVSDGPKSVTLNKASQAAVTVTAPSSVTFGTTGTATAAGGSGTGSYSFDATGSTGCSVLGTTVSVTNASNTCTLTATRAGDDNYNISSPSAPFTVTLNKATQAALALTVPPSITFGNTGTATASGGSGTGALTFSAGGTGGCSVNATTGLISVINASLTCTITASKAGDDNYAGPVSDGPKSITLAKATQASLSLTVPPSITFGTTGTATTTGGSGTGALSFSAGGTGGCSVNATTGEISVINASLTCTITASKAGDDNYLGPVSDGPKSVTLQKATQAALNLTVPANITFGNTGTATASGGSGTGALSFSAGGTGGCSVNPTTGEISVINASKTCEITASKAGDDNYVGPIADGPKSVTLLKAAQAVLSLTVPPSITFGSTGTATASGGSGTGALTFSAGASTGCSVNATTGVISVTNASHTCDISASKAGDDNYLGPVSDGPKSVTLLKAPQAALTLTVPASITYGTTGTATTSGGSGAGAVTFSAGGTGGCSVNTSTGEISVVNASHTCDITASKAGDDNYLGPVSDGPKSVTLVKANQSAVTVTGPSSVTYLTTGTATASGGNGTGGYSFFSTGSTGCSVSGTSVSVSDASGSCSLTAKRAADDNYNESSLSAPFLVTLVKANQTITFGALPGKINGDPDFTVSATATSGLGVGFAAGAGDQCTVSGTTVHITGAGSCTVTASQGGNNNYNPATSVPQTFTIAVNQAPVLGAITLSTTDPIQKGTTLNLSSFFTDADQPESTPYAYSINWGDGSTPTSQTGIVSPGSISGSHAYSAAGVYVVTVSVTDKINTTASGAAVGSYRYVVVYDPSAGFVTGGGWFISPSGACQLTTVCQSAIGKANFGFVAKYQKGQSTPDGNTEFQFQAGNLNFKSTSYDWLVVAGSRAQYKGIGTINGGGKYGFMITAIDGSKNGGSDLFRMKIWIKNADGTDGPVVYDNQMGAADDGTPTTSLGGGSIQIHN